MPHPVTLRTLGNAYCALRSSFLAYLNDARPYVGPKDEAAEGVLDELIARQDEIAERIGAAIRALGEDEPSCDFPAEFTDANDLSIAYTMRRAAENHRTVLARVRQLQEEASDPNTDEVLENAVNELEAIAQQFDLVTKDSTAATR